MSTRRLQLYLTTLDTKYTNRRKIIYVKLFQLLSKCIIVIESVPSTITKVSRTLNNSSFSSVDVSVDRFSLHPGEMYTISKTIVKP